MPTDFPSYPAPGGGTCRLGPALRPRAEVRAARLAGATGTNPDNGLTFAALRPLHRTKVGAGQKVGIVGLGGLGRLGAKIAAALGARVVPFTTSPGKTADVLRLGAKEVEVSRNPEEMNPPHAPQRCEISTVREPLAA